MRVQILLYDGFDELDALGPFEVLHAAAAAGAKLEVELARLDRATLTSARGLQLHVVGRVEPGAAPGLLILPGGGWLARATHGAWAEVERGRIAARAAEFHRGGTILASVCTGAMFLAAAGLLRDRPATTHRAARDDLEAAGARFVQARVVDHGDVITSGGITSGLDLALWVVERFAGAAIAHEVEHRIEYERRGTVWREG